MYMQVEQVVRNYAVITAVDVTDGANEKAIRGRASWSIRT